MRLQDADLSLDDSNAIFARFASRWEPDYPPPGPICMFGETPMKAYEKGWGRMFSGGKVRPMSGENWGLDNGAWAAFLRGEDFPTDEFLERLEQAQEAAEEADCPPTVAVVPDRVMAGMESLEFSVEWIESGRLPKDWPWFLALQGGMTVEGVEEVVEHFDGIFLGGANEMKPSGRIWSRFARRHSLPFHYGGCGTPGKLSHAFDLGATSMDSVGPVRTKKSLFRFLSHYDALARQYPDYQGTVGKEETDGEE